jgi:hypothetical protein
LIEIGVMDCLASERGLARARTLGYPTQPAMKLLEVGEHEERLAQLESVMAPRLKKAGGRR